MPAARRLELLRVCARHGVMIIEDDPYTLLADTAPPPLAASAPAQVAHIATLSKCLAPGLRTAFVLLHSALRERFMTALRALVLMATPLTSALTTSGYTMARHNSCCTACGRKRASASVWPASCWRAAASLTAPT
jgi:DNA-binding transcriptional MocR family regulator